MYIGVNCLKNRKKNFSNLQVFISDQYFLMDKSKKKFSDEKGQEEVKIKELISKNSSLEALVLDLKKDLKNIKEELQAKSSDLELFEAVFNSSVDGIFAFDKELKLLAWNRN